MVPGDPKVAHGSPAYEYGSQVANLENLSVVDLTGRITQGNKIDMAIYIYITTVDKKCLPAKAPPRH